MQKQSQSKLATYLTVRRVTSLNPSLASDIHREDVVAKTNVRSFGYPSTATATVTEQQQQQQKQQKQSQQIRIFLTTTALAEGLNARKAKVV